MAATADPHDLDRFVTAQQGVYAQALAELRAGRKRSHWMWFVLPQMAGLGRSAMAAHYGIASLAEARAYLAHPVLGPRLRDCVDALNAVEAADAVAVMGAVDAMKLRSCLTLFAAAAVVEDDVARFRRALDRYFAGEPDAATLALLPADGAP